MTGRRRLILIAALLAPMLLLAGCGGETGQSEDGTSPPADDAGQTVTALAAGPTLTTSPEFQRYEESHFGFFRPAGSYAYVSELGVHWSRPHPGPFVWGVIEKTPGTYDWSQADQYVRDSQASQVLITATIWPYADWDQRQCHEKLPGAPFRFMPTLGDYHGKPCDQDAYRRFVTASVERYDGDGVDDMPGLTLPIKYWEVINEPEGDIPIPFFKGSDQAADYLAVLKTTSQTVKAADPDAHVLNGGIAHPLNDQRKNFWETVLADGSPFIDVLTIHAVPAPDDLNLVPLQGVIDDLDLKKPVWVTEIQLAPSREFDGAGQSDADADASTSANSEAEQDRWSAVLVRDFVAAFGRGADKLFYVGLDNATPTAPAARLIDCSVVVGGELEEDRLQLSDCRKQKLFYAFKTMAARIDYFDSVQQLADCQYRFLVGDRTVYVLWGDQPPAVEISGRVRLTDIYGAQVELDAADIKLTETPVYVEFIEP